MLQASPPGLPGDGRSTKAALFEALASPTATNWNLDVPAQLRRGRHLPNQPPYRSISWIARFPQLTRSWGEHPLVGLALSSAFATVSSAKDSGRALPRARLKVEPGFRSVCGLICG
jgi:hypothetical protein